MSHPSRIVSLVPSATETLFVLGLGERVIGVSHACDWPPEAAGRPALTRPRIDAAQNGPEIDAQVQGLLASGEPLYELDEQRLERLEPDLIVTQAQCDVCAVRHDDVVRLVSLRPGLRNTRILALEPRTLADALCDVLRVAEAAGAADAGRRLDASLRARIAAVRARVGEPSGGPPVVACLEWLDPLMLSGNWGPELVALAGGAQPLTAAGVHSGYVEWPSVRAADPQVIVLCPCGFDAPRAAEEGRALATLPGWDTVAAVRSGRVFAVDGNAYFNRPGPRLVDSLELLAHLIWPARCPPPPAPPGAWQRVPAASVGC